MSTRSSSRDSGPLPTGTLTFLFTDIEGSTRMVNALGPAFVATLERHHTLMRSAVGAVGGTVVATEGDAFFVVFERATDALAGAAAAQRAMATEAWPSEAAVVRVRMGLHTGEGSLGGDNYVGIDVHRAARISAAAHGGQVLVSASTRALVEGSLPAGLRLRDLGEFRLKDLERPERLNQLVIDGLPEAFPPPRTLETPTNLPAQVTTFVGREREVADASALVRRSRLVTFTGPGGSGKTRLSMAVAEQLRLDFPAGAFFVDLSTVADPDLIAATIARALSLAEDANGQVIESLEAHLRDLRLLIVLDNLEQLLRGASMISRLLEAAPGLTVVATSRELLRLRGEQEYVVPPLGTPDLAHLPNLGDLARFDAVALFVQRARTARPEFQLGADNAAAVAAICARLDGLPLAIELAAARVKLFAPDALLARLAKRLTLLTSTSRDLPERQRTLRGAIEWSHDLLDSTERTLFRRLAVFVGGFTFESAEAICDPEAAMGVDMLDALSSFVDKSLLREMPGLAGEPRFAMLETIREYAVEQLAASDDAIPCRQRHVAWFVALAHEAEPELLGSHQREWLDRLDAEHDNLRAAMQSAADDGSIELAISMGASLWRFWQQRGHLAEDRPGLAALLELPEAASRTAARARALGAIGGIAWWQGDFDVAGSAYAEALDIERELDDPAGLADALSNSGYVASVRGDFASALADFNESLDIYRRLGDRSNVARVREATVLPMVRQGNVGPAQQQQEQNVVAFRELGQPFRLANGLSLLAAICTRNQDYAGAHAALAEAGPLFRGSRDLQGMVRILILAAALAIAESEDGRAARLMGAADRLHEPLGEISTPLTILRIDDPEVAARAALGDEAFEAAYQQGRKADLDTFMRDEGL